MLANSLCEDCTTLSFGVLQRTSDARWLEFSASELLGPIDVLSLTSARFTITQLPDGEFRSESRALGGFDVFASESD